MFLLKAPMKNFSNEFIKKSIKCHKKAAKCSLKQENRYKKKQQNSMYHDKLSTYNLYIPKQEIFSHFFSLCSINIKNSLIVRFSFIDDRICDLTIQVSIAMDY